MKSKSLGILLFLGLLSCLATPLAAQFGGAAPADPEQPKPAATLVPSSGFSISDFLLPNGEPPAVATPAAEEIVQGTHWVLIICGHPGDEDHRSLFAETIETLHDALITNAGFDSAKIMVQFGSEVLPDDGPAVSSSRGEATAEELRVQLEQLAGQITEHDTLWTIVMGHAHHNGRHTFLNLPGPDVHQDDFATWFKGIQGRQVFLITTPVSGFFIRPLTGDNRLVITSTQADLEVNETLYPLALAEVLSAPPPMSQFDVDSDQKITLFDLYITITRNVAQRYLDENLLATEHPLLDDNGDGNGTELQLDYLTVEQGGRAREDASPPKIRPNSDGAQAILFELGMLQLPAEVPAETPAEAPAADEPVEDKPAGEEPAPEDSSADEPAAEASEDASSVEETEAPATNASEVDATAPVEQEAE